MGWCASLDSHGDRSFRIAFRRGLSIDSRICSTVGGSTYCGAFIGVCGGTAGDTNKEVLDSTAPAIPANRPKRAVVIARRGCLVPGAGIEPASPVYEAGEIPYLPPGTFHTRLPAPAIARVGDRVSLLIIALSLLEESELSTSLPPAPRTGKR